MRARVLSPHSSFLSAATFQEEVSTTAFLPLTPAGTRIAPLMSRWGQRLIDEKGWIHPGKRYRDAPWWYNEQATLSHLAGTTWREGGLALQEYATFKTREPGRRSLGRADLWLTMEPTKPGGTAIEAKQFWPTLQRATVDADLALDWMDTAWGEAKNNHPSDERLGLVLVTPSIASRRLDDFAKKSYEFLEAACTSERPDFILAAWRRKATVPISSRSGRCFPGIVVLGRYVQKRGRPTNL